MSDTYSEYKLTDVDDENLVSRVVFVHRTCCCMSPGCVDDEIQIFENGNKYTPYALQVPRLITPYIEGLFNGEYKLTDKNGQSLI